MRHTRASAGYAQLEANCRPVRTELDRPGAPRTKNPKVPTNGKRNARNVWTIATQPYKGAHFATMPPALAERCIKAGCPSDGCVLDPFAGSGTTGLVADRLGRDATLIDLSPAYQDMAVGRLEADAGLFSDIQRKTPAPAESGGKV